MNRRSFLSAAAATAGLALAKPAFVSKTASSVLGRKERVDRALRGQDLDRPPFTFYHHYKRPTAQLEAQDHLEFHRTYKAVTPCAQPTDASKMMMIPEINTEIIRRFMLMLVLSSWYSEG